MQDIATQTDSIFIGIPVYENLYGKSGFVCRIEASALRDAVIGANGFQSVRSTLTIVYDDLTFTEVPDAIAAPWIEAAKESGHPPISADDASTMLSRAMEKRAKALATASEESERRKREREAFEADAVKRFPTWAKAVIVAELERDDCDSMTDYFNTVREKTVILGFSKHTRDLFPELRKAARNYQHTASLADAPESAEHREKYSMGHGYYLKAEGRYRSGWLVRKIRLYGDNPVKSIPSGEWSLAPESTAPAVTPRGVDNSGIRIEEHTHTKKGFQMFICVMPERVDRTEFDRLRDIAQTLGGWYSRPWGKTPGGFAFKDKASAEAFANPTDSTPPDNNGPRSPRRDIGDKLRKLADGMQGEIDGKFRDRLTNTPKRQREAQSARLDGYRLQRAQAGLRALADLHDAGTVPTILADVTSKKAAFELAYGEIVSTGGYYDAGHETGNPGRTGEKAAKFWELATNNTKVDHAAEELRQKIEGLQFANIPGYFPTPRAIIDQMIELAEIGDGPCDILEPSAGHGAIVDALAEVCPNASVFACEVWQTLREILTAKGTRLVGRDFLEYEPDRAFDRVIMNPPFEKGQDMEHVQRAFMLLAPGGILVAIMSPHFTFASTSKATAFREWLRDKVWHIHELPAGSFKESGTGVAANIVVIEKE